MSYSATCSMNLKSSSRNRLKDLFVVLGASLFLSLCGSICIPLPFTPVPIAIQLQAVFFLSLLLGSRRAFFAVMAFIAQGVLGLPVFAGGATGLHTLFGPSGFYIFGYAAAACIIPYYVEKMGRTVGHTAIGITLGNLVIYATGSLWLAHFVGGYPSALLLGVAPFVAGDILKNALLVKGLKEFGFFRHTSSI